MERASPPPTPSRSSATPESTRQRQTSGIAPRPLGPSPSPSSSSLLPDSEQDLTANISLGTPSIRNGDAGLVCPICEEEMVTLLQLNRHIDDVHQELPEIQQDEVKTWFDKQVNKAKKFQPLSLINQKLRGLDVFESNGTPSFQPSSSNSNGNSNGNGNGSARPLETIVDADQFITRKHWQRSTGFDVCTDPTCAKRLGPLNGNINCRKCGKLFCEAHTMYQVKLSRSAAYDPVRGYWARVCETCFKSRPGYNDHHGAESDLFGGFAAVRTKRVERQNLEVARLEKRLTKLTHLLAEVSLGVSVEGGGASRSSLAGQHKLPKKNIEQSIVTWEEDSSVVRCPICQQEFGSWTLRRHHCRICGRVVCADPQTGCSTEVGLAVAATPLPVAHAAESAPEKKTHSSAASASPKTLPLSVDVRMCCDCKATLFSKRDFEASLAAKPADQRAFETLRQFEWGIRQMMPLFQQALQSLQADGTDKPPPTHAQIQEAAKIRKRLMDSFIKYNLAAVRLRDLRTDSPTQQRLQKAVYTAASTFLHANMVPLKHVPKMLRAHQGSRSSSSMHRRLLTGHDGIGSGNGSPLRNDDSAWDGDTTSVAGSEVSTAMSVLETEEKELRERLIVLEEQRFLVQQMVDNARGSQRIEEVGALTRNMDELDVEIKRLRKQVGGVEERWQGLYAAGGG